MIEVQEQILKKRESVCLCANSDKNEITENYREILKKCAD